MIRVKGEKICLMPMDGTSKYYYGFDESLDFYELEKSENTKPNRIFFYKIGEKEKIAPFEKERDTYFDMKVHFEDGLCYFLRYKKREKLIYIHSFDIEKRELKTLIRLDTEFMKFYNLMIIGSRISLIADREENEDDNGVIFYYPDDMIMSLDLDQNETIVYVDDREIVTSIWYEEGLDEDGNIIEEEYSYIEKVITRDLKGKILNIEEGYITRTPDGEYIIS